MKKVVVIGGGTGVFTVLTGLREYPDLKLSAIVSMADDGGSTGLLREEFGTLPPGDIRRALIALSGSNKEILSQLFNYRFEKNSSLHGHTVGNILLTALEKITGSFPEAIAEAVKILNVKGKVIPVTLSQAKLVAELEDGTKIYGESNIDIPKHDGKKKIKRAFLSSKAVANPDAIKEIKQADAVILGPGDLYTSIIPNLLIEGIPEALKETKALRLAQGKQSKIIYNVNIMTKFGETNGFKASDFIKIIEEYLGEGVIDYIVVNTEKPKGSIVKRYEKENVEFVVDDIKDTEKPKVVRGDFLRHGMFLRHDPEKLAKALASIIDA